MHVKLPRPSRNGPQAFFFFYFLFKEAKANLEIADSNHQNSQGLNDCFIGLILIS